MKRERLALIVLVPLAALCVIAFVVELALAGAALAAPRQLSDPHALNQVVSHSKVFIMTTSHDQETEELADQIKGAFINATVIPYGGVPNLPPGVWVIVREHYGIWRLGAPWREGQPFDRTTRDEGESVCAALYKSGIEAHVSRRDAVNALVPDDGILIVVAPQPKTPADQGAAYWFCHDPG